MSHPAQGINVRPSAPAPVSLPNWHDHAIVLAAQPCAEPAIACQQNDQGEWEVLFRHPVLRNQMLTDRIWQATLRRWHMPRFAVARADGVLTFTDRSEAEQAAWQVLGRMRQIGYDL